MTRPEVRSRNLRTRMPRVNDAPIRIDSFGRRYRRTRPWALREVSLTVPDGSITALVGPNGAGKSTLIRACVGFERPDEGRVLVHGIDPQRNRAQAVNRIGYIPQAASLYRKLTVEDHFSLARASRSTFDKSYATERIQAAGLDLDRVVGELSGGEQSQLALAIALGTMAPLLLLDEPLASLDPLARRDFLAALVVHTRKRGATALLSSHIVTDIEQACDRLVVLASGRLMLDTEIASAKTIFKTLPANQLDGHLPVGIFSDPGGDRLGLVRDSENGQPASLEEIVLGHLASARLDTATADSE
jgi:ABC-2 type transport system ATP-binding protein